MGVGRVGVATEESGASKSRQVFKRGKDEKFNMCQGIGKQESESGTVSILSVKSSLEPFGFFWLLRRARQGLRLVRQDQSIQDNFRD